MTKALAGKIGRRLVTCEGRGRDRYGRTVAVCYAGGEDLSAWMLEQGLGAHVQRLSGVFIN